MQNPSEENSTLAEKFNTSFNNKELPPSNDHLFRQEKEQQIQHDAEAHDLRKEYVPKLYKLLIWWLIGIGSYITVYICLSAFYIYYCMFNNLNNHCHIISPTVNVAIIATNTASVLGVIFIMFRWLYPQQNKNLKR